MTKFIFLLIAVLSICQVIGDEPIPLIPIRIPIAEPDVPEPAPIPDRSPVSDLKADEWYVIDSDIPCLVLCSRESKVKVSRDTGPMRMRGKFVGGKGIETREFTGKYVFTIEAREKGEVEILIVPVGAEHESDVIRQVLTVMGGGPNPPPDPDPGPDPTPDPDPDPDPTPIPSAGKRVLIVYESADLSKYPQSQVNQLASSILRKYLMDKCSKGPDGITPEFRIWDKDVDLTHVPQVWKEAMLLPRSSLTLIVSNGVEGFSGPLPLTEAETITILRRYLE